MNTRTSLVSLVRRGCALLGAAGIVSACGGGSTAPHLSSSASSQSVAKGTATLTIQFPANYHHAMTHARVGEALPAGAKRVSTSSKRTPKFIDPTAGDVLNITVSPTSGGSYTVTPSGGVAVVPNGSDNSQVFSVTIPAGSYYSATATETDSNGTTIATGTNNSTFTIGAGSSGNTLAVTMDMIPAGIVLTTDIVAGGDATLLTSDGSTAFCAFGTPHQTIYAFTADDQAGYVLPGTAAGGIVDNNGYSTVPVPQLNSSDPSDASTIAASSFANAYIVTFVQPSSSTILGSFNAYSPGLQTSASGNFQLAGAGSSTCMPTGSFNPYYVSGSGQTSTLQITGGTAPYSVTETDGNCTFAQADSPLTDQWTFTTITSGGECDATITDHNQTSTSAILEIYGP